MCFVPIFMCLFRASVWSLRWALTSFVQLLMSVDQFSSHLVNYRLQRPRGLEHKGTDDCLRLRF
jgi:hypothetical protein